jgi:hypothetical protein
VIALEFIMSMMIAVIVFLATFEFGILVLVQQAATTAAIEGAREGAKVFPGFPFPFQDPSGEPSPDPADLDDIADYVASVVDDILNIHGVDVAPAAPSGRATALVIVERREGGGPVQVAQRGDTTIDCEPSGPSLNPDELRVTVCFRLVNDVAGGLGNPIPDWLAPFGFSWGDRHFVMSSRANLE